MKNGEWTVSEDLESDYFKIIDYKAENSGHRGKWILWKSKVIDILIDEFRREYKEEKENGKK